MKTFRHLVALLRRNRLEADMAEEMRLHLEQRAREHVADGVSPEEARYAALRQFGQVVNIQEQVRRQRGWEWVQQVRHETRLVFRQLRRSPGFTGVAIATLALGIGLNTAMFSFVNTLVLRPLPFPDSGRLVLLYRTTAQGQYGGFSPADYLDLKRAEAGFGRFAAYEVTSMALGDSRRPVEWMRASDDLFEVLGVRPTLGRTFRPEEGIEGRQHVVVLSYEVWQDQFQGAADAIGQTVRGNGEIYEIIGVLPPAASDHRLFEHAGLFSPLSFDGESRAERGNHGLSLLGRRLPQHSATEGDLFVSAFGNRLATDFPVEDAGSSWRCDGLPLSTISPTGRAMIYMLLGLSGCVLAIACSNLANLLLARTIERTREFAVRAALGASRVQLIRPLVLEAAVLALAGGVGALFVASWTTNWLNSVILDGGGPAFGFPMDWRVLAFASGVCGLTLFFFGVGPALFAGRINANDLLKSGARGALGGLGHQRFRRVLIAGQFAFAMVLLSGAGFFLRGADNLMKQPHGWNSERVAKGNVVLPVERYADDAAVTGVQRQLIERLENMPGVEAASVSYGLPYLGLRGQDRFVTEANQSAAPGQELMVKINGISPGYFKVTGTRLISGRRFNERDTANSPRVAIINETMARTFFREASPLGKRIASASTEPRVWVEIVGVVGDVRSIDVAQEVANYQFYQPACQDPHRELFVAVRTAEGAPGEKAGADSIRAAVAVLDPGLQVVDLMSADRAMELITSQIYFCRQLLTAFSVLGLSLAALGIYGVIGRMVVQRTGEIGLRMALGAKVSDVVRLVLGSGIRLAVTGAAAGLLGGIGLSRFFASIFPTMQTNGSLVLVAATSILVVVALVASWLPARRAATVDPMTALRAE